MSNTVHAICKHRIVGSPTRKAVLLLMADFASDDGSGIWASKQNMADDLEMGVSTLRDAIKALISSGIVIEVGSRKHHNGYTVEYRIDLSVVLGLPVTRQNTPFLTPTGAAPLREPKVTPAGAGGQDLRELEVNHPLTIIEPPEDNKRTRRAMALPPNWIPSDRNLLDAKSKDFTEDEINEQAAAFRDYHLARGTTFKDWDAAWRTWLGNARRFGRPAPARNAGARSAHDGMLAGFQSAVARRL